MAKFRLEINVEPKDIHGLDDSHKRDCADALAGVISRTFKYSLIFTGAAMIFFGAYSLFSFTYLMRMGKMLPQLPLAMPTAALAAFLLAFAAAAMQKWALIAEMALDVVVGLTFLASRDTALQTLWLLPFALYGAFAQFRLLTLMPLYKAISAEEGYPEFTPLPTKDDIAKKETVPEKSGEPTPENGEKVPQDTKD